MRSSPTYNATALVAGMIEAKILLRNFEKNKKKLTVPSGLNKKRQNCHQL